MVEQPDGLKRNVAEIKFLIHDLRVERFINEVIHFHATVNTDLEIHNIAQAQAHHDEDLQELKSKAVIQRRALDKYNEAVKGFAADEEILKLGREYVQSVYDTCEFIMDPRWEQTESFLALLPETSRAVRSYRHCLNCVRWISGVYYRIHYFMEEKDHDLYEKFDIAEELRDFVRNVVYSYVIEKTHARVEIRLNQLDSAVLGGNRHRFRRMVFNLVMNAVDAMAHKKVGVLTISCQVDGDYVMLRVRDIGSGMTREKIEQLMTDRESLDGELHSLGFVFVRQTVAQFNGSLSIDSMINKGTTISILLPRLVGETVEAHKPVQYQKVDLREKINKVRMEERSAYLKKTAKRGTGHDTCGETIYGDYLTSDAEFPGAIFSIGVTKDNEVDLFTHRPYERHWNITHEDLSPMLFEAVVRGRLEEEEDKTPTLIFKCPQSVQEYFEFRGVPEAERTPQNYITMVHDELIRISRVIIETGMPEEISVRVTDLNKFFAYYQELSELESFPLKILARLKQHSEKGPEA
jgi:signal transduction histidine kinase